MGRGGTGGGDASMDLDRTCGETGRTALLLLSTIPDRRRGGVMGDVGRDDEDVRRIVVVVLAVVSGEVGRLTDDASRDGDRGDPGLLGAVAAALLTA